MVFQDSLYILHSASGFKFNAEFTCAKNRKGAALSAPRLALKAPLSRTLNHFNCASHILDDGIANRVQFRIDGHHP